MPRTPLLLRLPFWLADDGFRLDRAVARDPRWTVRPDHAVSRLRLSGPERRFARTLLRERRSWWVYRCDQARGCGDFVLVPMSPPDPADRVPVALELKERSPLKPGGGLQLRNSGAAVGELVALGVVGSNQHVRLEGSSGAVLQRMGVC
jgi:hypothetical protein